MHRWGSHYKLIRKSILNLPIGVFRTFDEIITIQTAHGSECFMIPNQVKDLQDDAATKSSANVIVSNQSRVACNGGGGTLGHPKIFLTMGNDGMAICPYCSRQFVKLTD